MPVQWIMDDAPLFRHVYGATNAIADPGRVLQMWSKEFAAMHRGERLLRADLPSLHQRARLAHRSSSRTWCATCGGSAGVWFTTCEEVARWHDKQP